LCEYRPAYFKHPIKREGGSVFESSIQAIRSLGLLETPNLAAALPEVSNFGLEVKRSFTDRVSCHVAIVA
jgi:hypothetical protein